MNYDKIFINGEWIRPSSQEIIEVENPANKRIIGSVPASKEADVNKAVASAKEALETWQFLDLKERIEFMEKLLKELRNRIGDKVDVIVKELGSPEYFARDTHVLPYLDEIEYLIELMKDYPLEEKHEDFIIVKT